MNEVTNTSLCGRGNDLVSFLYGEANDSEAREFEQHLQECTGCKSEVASFGQLRSSIGTWKDEALSVFVAPQVMAPMRKKSAVAALREFFDLSPLWMKGAVGFATVLFCVMLGLLIFPSSGQKNSVDIAEDKGKFTQDQVNQLVKKALEDQAAQVASNNQTEQPKIIATPVVPPKKNKISTGNSGSSQTAKRRSLSKSEREQLAADLRLFSTRDDENLNLLGDKINQEF